MPRKAINPELGAKLVRIRAKREAKKKRMEELAKQYIGENLAAIDRDIEETVVAMYTGGSTYAEIKRAYGTKNHTTITDILKKAES